MENLSPDCKRVHLLIGAAKTAVLTATFLFMVGFAPSARADEGAEEPLVNQVKSSIDRGVKFLKEQSKDGQWNSRGGRNGGVTALALLALLNAGVKPDDPVISGGLKYLRTIDPKETYVVGLQTMVYNQAGHKEDFPRIQKNVDWLISARCLNGKELKGWSYSKAGNIGNFGGDNSNTQFAILGLYEGQMAGAKIDKAVWESIRAFYIKTQSAEGGWGYSSVPMKGGEAASLTMSTAGLCGLLIAGMQLNPGRENFGADGVAKNCGNYEESKAIATALDWVGNNFSIGKKQHYLHYSLYGIERAGRLTGHRFIGKHDWYREGCEFLVKNQQVSGSWGDETNTCFSLLFLSKGRTPVLISKLTHGKGTDWNNDRNDARHLVEFSSKELFERQPLAWQVFDARRGLVDNNREELTALVADLLQSPIAYFNGHQAPNFTDAEKEILKEYVEQGGFILADACCGDKRFDKGFRELMKELFPDNPLKPLADEHPLWNARSPIKLDGCPFKLEGIEKGCKTVVVYSPQDLSCLWEANRQDNDRCVLAFRLGVNIVAFATGMELPKPRLTQFKVIKGAQEEKELPKRGFVKVAQLRHQGHWQPAPRAMSNLMLHIRDKVKLDVAIQTQALHPGDPDLVKYKLLYMHGRGNFTFTKEEIDNLRADLQTGALLFADACCGKKPFDESFREVINKTFPDNKLQPIPLDDPLFGKELNGEAIQKVRCRHVVANGYKEEDPLLEGIKVNNRWVVIYSKYDIGCALEKHQSGDCLGHDYQSALRLGTAAILYALSR